MNHDMDDILITVATFFDALWSQEGNEEGAEDSGHLSHFDGQLHWAASFDSKLNYLRITAGLNSEENHVLESHGFYQSARIVELNGGIQALILRPVEAQDDSNGTFIARLKTGFLELEMCVGRTEPAVGVPEEVPEE